MRCNVYSIRNNKRIERIQYSYILEWFLYSWLHYILAG